MKPKNPKHSGVDPPQFESARTWLVRGYTRFVIRILWWNIFTLLAVAIFAGLIFSAQGQELLRISAEDDSRSFRSLEAYLLPMVLFALLTGLTSVITSHAGTWQLEALADMFGID